MMQESEAPVPSSQPVEQEPALNRRQFLGGVGGTAAALTLGGLGLEAALPTAAEAHEVGPLIGVPRLEAAVELRKSLAERIKLSGIPNLHPCNGDEELYPNRIGNYSKGLPHDEVGEVKPYAYDAMLYALSTGKSADFEEIPLGGGRKLVNPQAGLAFEVEGLDPHQFKFPVAPAFASAEEAAEAVELYWMYLLRDVSFTDYATSDLAAKAADELTGLPAFKGPRDGLGRVTPQLLFRDNVPGALSGPYLSQFLLLPTPFGAEYVERKMWTLKEGSDHMTDFHEWLDVQNGNVPGVEFFDESQRRFIRRGRDLGQWVHIDVLFQAYFNACLILGTPPSHLPNHGGIGCPPNPGNPYNGSKTQEGFGTWGGPAFKALLCEVATRALKAIWFQKWFVQRRLRPEAFGGRIHVHKQGWRNYPIHSTVLNSKALAITAEQNGAYLLPMVFPEGSPTHPAYGAGHATVAGACVTVLKAFFDENFPLQNPVVPDPTGTALVPLADDIHLTVGGELNKLASNVATGRNIAGVHWRSDGINSLLLGEQVAIHVLRDHKALFNEGGKFIFTGFNGNVIQI